MQKARFPTDLIHKNRYIIPLIAFLIPLLIRSIPELLNGPYIVGFDTMGFYVPNTLLWLHNGFELWGYLTFAPLFYTLLMSIVAAGIPIIIALKILPPLFLGLLSISIYFFARSGLGWSSTKSLMPALLGTLYFVALRISWDMLRNELGLIFLFFALTLLTKICNGAKRNYFFLSLILFAVVLSHQLTSVVLIGIIAFTIVYGFFQKDFKKSVSLIVVAMPAVVFFFILYLAGVAGLGFQDYATNTAFSLAAWISFPSYQTMLLSELGFFLYCFLPLLPLVALSFKGIGNFQLRVWILLSLVLALIPFAFVSPFRWLLFLTYPLSFYVTEAMSRIKSIKLRSSKINLHKFATLYLVLSTSLLSFGFIVMPPECPFIYFNPQYVNNYQYQMPTSMLQNTISITDYRDTDNALEWFRTNINSSAQLLVHTVFYSWALLHVDNTQIKYYGFDDPTIVASNATKEGQTGLYLIWWINGAGWYDQQTLPLPFQELYHSGRIAIYYYNPLIE